MAEKLSFGLEFQEELLRFAIHDKKGPKLLEYISSNSYSLISHSVIMYGIEKAFQKWHRIPGKPVLLETIQGVFKERDFANALLDEDRTDIITLIGNIYERPAKDGDILLEQAAKFGAFVALKGTLEEVDLTDFDSYHMFSSRVHEAIKIQETKEESRGIFLIKDIRDRQMRRQIKSSVIPTPWRQINNLTSAGGYGKGSIIVFMDRPKNLKTFALIQMARGYMRMRKRVLVIDLENGEDELSMRLEQSTAKITKKQLLKGDHDQHVQKVLRRYRRMGGETVIKRMPAYSKASAIQAYIDEMYREHGIQFDVLIVDYIALMGSGSSKLDEETTRIGAAFIDVANLALHNDFDHVVTAMHVTRSAFPRSETRYLETDIAKAIDIIRHVQAIYGLNRNQDERDAGIIRAEIVAQRDGIDEGRAYFYADPTIQRWEELTKAQIKEVEAAQEEEEESREQSNKPKPKGDM